MLPPHQFSVGLLWTEVPKNSSKVEKLPTPTIDGFDKSDFPILNILVLIRALDNFYIFYLFI